MGTTKSKILIVSHFQLRIHIFISGISINTFMKINKKLSVEDKTKNGFRQNFLLPLKTQQVLMTPDQFSTNAVA